MRSGKPFRVLTAIQALSRRHQYAITELLIAHEVGREVFTSGLDASRLVPMVRFC